MTNERRLSMRSLIGICVCILVVIGGGGSATTLSAQVPAVGSDKLGWTQSAATDEIDQLTFAIFIDGARQPLPGAACVAAATGTYDCQAAFPAMTPGTHVIELVAIRTIGTSVLESVKSEPLSVSFVVVPTAPASLRVVKV